MLKGLCRVNANDDGFWRIRFSDAVCLVPFARARLVVVRLVVEDTKRRDDRAKVDVRPERSMVPIESRKGQDQLLLHLPQIVASREVEQRHSLVKGMEMSIRLRYLLPYAHSSQPSPKLGAKTFGAMLALRHRSGLRTWVCNRMGTFVYRLTMFEADH